MKKTAKWAGLVVASAVCITSVAVFTACNENTPEVKEYTVTYYDGDAILKTETVKDGEKATRWIPEKDDYIFVDWYAVPNSTTFKFNFDEPITENKQAFSMWTSADQTEDTREYYIVGAGTSPILSASNWGKLFDETTKMTKAADKNEYTFTVDLYKGDEFQFALNESWHNQRGFGYLDSLTTPDGTTAFSGSATIGDNAAYRLNIKCEYSGNYTFTLTTHPDDDTYETTNSSYTEESKEAFNINPLDSITWVRNGDVTAAGEVITDIYIKGATITNWGDVYSPATKMTNTDGVYTLEVYLKAGDEFMFTSLNTIGTAEPTTGTLYVRGSNLDEDSKQYVETLASQNMKAKADGTYTFTYNDETGVLSIAFDADKALAAYDYYLDGTFGGGAWGDFMNDKEAHKLTETATGSGIYKIESVELAVDDELVIRAYAKGTKELTWENGAYNYNSQFLVGDGELADKASVTNANIKALVAGTYDITIDSYSKIITIAVHKEDVDTLDIYIKGENVNSWSHGWSEDYRFTLSDDETTYEYTLTVESGKPVNLGFEKHPKGETTGFGTYLGVSALGTSGDANSLFTPESGSNFACSTAGTYKIVFDIATEKIDFYAVTNA